MKKEVPQFEPKEEENETVAFKPVKENKFKKVEEKEVAFKVVE